MDVNFCQLKLGVSLQDGLKEHNTTFPLSKKDNNNEELKLSLEYKLPRSEHLEKLSFVNATSTLLPFADNSVDRIIALESAQHFRPLSEFFSESNRVLQNDGIFVIAIPVVTHNQKCAHLGNSMFSEVINLVSSFFRLGVLSFTWMSEHFDLNYVKSQIVKAGFQPVEMQLIGSHVYEPLSSYYIQNREKLRDAILKEYPSYIEKILYNSILKMNELSKKGVIDYAIIQAKK
jgi:SAM-dependent methyltransferase